MKITRRPYEQNFSGNPIVYGFYDQESIHNKDLLFEIRIHFKNEENAAAFELVTTISLTPYNGTADIDISDFLQSRLAFTVPDLNSQYTEARKQTGYFFVEYRRVSITDDLGEAYQTENQFIRKVFKGGLHPFMWVGNNFWLNYFAALNRFLTWQVNTRMAGFNETMFLAWYNDKAVPAGNIRYQVVTTYTDTTTATTEFALPAFNNRVYFIPAGATQLGIASPNKTVWFWTITVIDVTLPDNPQDLSEAFTFHLDQRNDYNGITLNYRNSLGGIDSMRIRGQIETTINLDGVEVETAAPADWVYQSLLPSYDRSQPHREMKVYKGDIGHLAKEEHERLRDAFLNREVWTVKGGRWWPVKLFPKQYKLNSTADKRFSMPVEFTIGDGGSYYYTPPINLGPGQNLRNVCDASISNLQPAIAYVTPDVADVTWTFDVQVAADAVNKIQWKIPGYEENWVDLIYPLVNPFKTTHAVPGQYVIYMRPVCTGGSPGAVFFKGVNVPVEPEDPGPDPDPHPLPNTSTLYNQTSIESPVNITINGQQVFYGVVNPFGNVTFEAIPGVHTVRAFFANIVTLSTAKLTTQAATYNGLKQSIDGGTMITFTGVDIITTFIIEIE